jgi:hypothetical protein
LTTSDPALFATAAGSRVPVWVGLIPAKLVFGAPFPDPARNRVAIAPEHGAGFRSKDDLRPACGAPPPANERT